MFHVEHRHDTVVIKPLTTGLGAVIMGTCSPLPRLRTDGDLEEEQGGDLHPRAL